MTPAKIMPEVTTPFWSRNARTVLWALVAIGVIAFFALALGAHPGRAWQIYLVNYLYWSGISVTGVVLIAMWRANHAGWAHLLRGVTLASFAFTPLAFLAFLVLIPARHHIFLWLGHPKPNRIVWLNPVFLFGRDLVSLLVLYGFCAWYAYYLLRPVLGVRKNPHGLRAWLVRGWRGAEAERELSIHKISRIGPPLLILYALVWSLIGFDLVMSLDQTFSSTLFGGYYFITTLYLGLAMVAVLAWLWRRREPALAAIIGTEEVHQLGKVLLAFDLLYTLMFWSQYLVIWYGNLAHEIPWLHHRQYDEPWEILSYTEVVVSLLLPFFILLSRRIKENPRTLAGVGILVMVGMWLERYVLVVPSLWGGGEAVALAASKGAAATATPSLPLGLPEILITAGFAAVFFLCYGSFARVFPVNLDITPEPRESPQFH